jgi:serine/threonine-protein kinase
MGAVYRAEHVFTRKVLATKVLHGEMSRVEEVVKRFEREARATSQIDHPNIIQVTDFGRDADTGALYLVMEYLEGESLADAIAHGGGLPLARALDIGRQILGALVAAHDGGIVHRDLKPDNILLVNREGRADFVKVLDFGIAKLSLEGNDGEPALTQAGVVFGTPEYISPEQALGQAADGRADLYAMGVILYEMLCGQRPFHSINKVEILGMHLTQPPRPPRAMAPDAGISPALELIILKALAKKRDDRYASARVMLEALEDVPGVPYQGEGTGRTMMPGMWVTSVAERAPKLTASLGPAARAATTRALQAAASLRHGGWRRPRALAALGGAAVALLVLAVVLLRGAGSKPVTPAVAPGTAVAAAGLPPVAPIAPRGRARPGPAAAASPVVGSDPVKERQRAETLLAGGEVTPALKILEELERRHPGDASVRFALGHAYYVADRPREALDRFQRALQMRPRLDRDPVLRSDLLEMARRGGAERSVALALWARTAGKGALPVLAEAAQNDRDPTIRLQARQAMERLGAKLPPASGGPGGSGAGIDEAPTPSETLPQELQQLIDQLSKGKSCKKRKEAVTALRQMGDVRAIPALKKARFRASGFLGRTNANGCLYKELRATLSELEEKGGRTPHSTAPLAP